MSGGAPIVGHRDRDAAFASFAGRTRTAGQFVADADRRAQWLRQRAAPAAHVINACADRYQFAVTFFAALIAERVNVLPGSRAPAALQQLRRAYPGALLVVDTPDAPDAADGAVVETAWSDDALWPPPQVAAGACAAIAFTSGSTGTPQPYPKEWGSLVESARAEAAALTLACSADDGEAFVATVAPQHMYGLETSLLLPVIGGAVFAAEQPLHPSEISAVLHAQRVPPVLVTTPVHLRALDASGVELPPLAAIVCATAALPLELAARCEGRWRTRVLEIYGCTETGQVAARRTVDGAQWQTLRGVRIEARDGMFWAGGGHIRSAAPLADQLQLRGAERFELLGRNADLVNLAGKRTSLAALDHALLSIEGVTDGAFFHPDAAQADREARLIAFVVAPQARRQDIVRRLRAQIDPVFLPRPLVFVERLPRNSTGKLPRAELQALAQRLAPREPV